MVGTAVFIVGFVLLAAQQDTFTTRATLVFTGPVPPPSSPDPITTPEVSPLARNSPTVVADTFTRLYNGATKRRELDAAGLVGDLTINNISAIEDNSPIYGPSLYITVEAPSPDLASRGIQLVIDDAVSELAARQVDYDPAQSVQLVEVVPPNSPRLISGSSIRVLVAFTALAFLVAMCVSFLLGAVASDDWVDPHRPRRAVDEIDEPRTRTSHTASHGTHRRSESSSPSSSRAEWSAAGSSGRRTSRRP